MARLALAGLLALSLSLPLVAAPRHAAAEEAAATTRTQFVVGRGDVAYLAQTGGMVIRDVSDPIRPRDLGWLALPGAVHDIALDGDRAYLAAGTRGLVIADISDPAEPRELARLNSDGKAKRVALAGDHAYLADGVGGLLVLDVTTVEDPRIVARISTGGDLRAVALSGELLAVAEAHGGARVFSLRDPGNPRELRRLRTDFAARDVCWIGERLFVAAGNTGVAVYEPRAGARPSEIVPPVRPAQHLACGDGLVAVSQLGSTLQLLQVTDEGIVERSRLRVHRTSPIGRSSLEGVRLWVAVDVVGMGLLDLSDPAEPAHLLPRRREFKLNY